MSIACLAGSNMARIPDNPQSDIRNGKPYFAEPIPPEILEWARKILNEEEIAAGLREIRETGGLELVGFIHELEQIVTPLEGIIERTNREPSSRNVRGQAGVAAGS